MTGVVSGIEAAQIGALFSRARLVLAVSAVNAIITAFFLRHAAPPLSVTAWVLSILVISAARFWYVLDYERDEPKRLDHWMRVSIWGSAISGAAWGLASIFLFPSASLVLQIFIPVVMMGMMAGSAVSWYAYFPAFIAYFIPVASLTLLRFAWEIMLRSEAHGLFVTLGAMFLIFTAGLYILARHSNRVLSQLLLARIEGKAEAALQMEMAKNRMLLKTGEDGLHVLDAKGNLLEAADSFCGMLGYAPGAMRGMNVLQWDADFRGDMSFEEKAARIPEEGVRFETKHRHRGGHLIDVEIRAHAASINGERFVWAYSRDVSGRKSIAESMALAGFVFQACDDAIMVLDGERRIVEVNPAFTGITGYEPAEVLGNRYPLHVEDPAFFGKLWRSVEETGCWQGEIWGCRKSGEIYAQSAHIGTFRQGAELRHVVQFSDITEQKKKDERIWLQANFDTLTNLPNRRLFRERLQKAMGEPNRFALLCMDIDRFKEINDTLGGDMGDLLLLEVATRIAACVQKTDTVARLGGDEFALVLPDSPDLVELDPVVEKIMTELGRPCMLDGEAVQVSASIGLAFYPDDALDADCLLKHADLAMHTAKAQGGNRFEYFTEAMQQQIAEKIALSRDLRMAAAKGELQIHYQPIVELDSGRIVKAEALLRWEHAVRGTIAPDLFVPIAEESGLIVEIGEWLFEEAARRVKAWQGRLNGGFSLSINKSPLQFAVAERNWLGKLAEFGLPKNSITIEITEGLLLKGSASARERLLAFHEGGIEISIDDFGTGFSSFSYLKQFDVDYLKIDRSFISGLTENERDMAITEAIIAMAHKLGIKIIAEGVETAGQRDLLLGFGCDYAQGYLYSPPVTSEEFENLLERVRL